MWDIIHPKQFWSSTKLVGFPFGHDSKAILLGQTGKEQHPQTMPKATQYYSIWENKNHHPSEHKEIKSEDVNHQGIATILHSAQSMVR